MAAVGRRLLRGLGGDFFGGQDSTVGFIGSSLLLGFSGALIALLTSGALAFSRWIRKYIYTVVEIRKGTQPYNWVMDWLAAHPDLNKSATRVVLEEAKSRVGNTNQMDGRQKWWFSAQNYAADSTPKKDKATIQFVPSSNVTYYLKYKGHHMWVRRFEPEVVAATGTTTAPDGIFINVLGNGKNVVRDLVIEAQQLHLEISKKRTVIWSPSARHPVWRPLDSRPSRPMDTVFLPGTLAEEVLEDAQEYLSSEAWYYDRGIPYRRGYLLYGPPGCGKTSFIMALAGELHLVICIINLSDSSMSDSALITLMASAPKHSIILLEDVDVAFASRRPADKPAGEEKEEPAPTSPTSASARRGGGGGGGIVRGGDISNTENRVTFSGLLNAIDGVAGQEGKLLFMTTNYADRLDEALLRPGRVDFQAKFGLATQEAINRLFLRFYRQDENNTPPASQENKDTYVRKKAKHYSKEELVTLAEKFSSQIPNEEYSMAKIQGHLMKHRHDPNDALSNIHNLKNAEPAPGVGNLMASPAVLSDDESKMLDFEGDGGEPRQRRGGGGGGGRGGRGGGRKDNLRRALGGGEGGGGRDGGGDGGGVRTRTATPFSEEAQ